MQIVIDINDKDYKSITQDYIEYANTTGGRVFKAIKNGIPLPKGHGRLIDADKIEYWKNDRPDEIGYHFAPKYIIDDAPTIIEADTKSEDM